MLTAPVLPLVAVDEYLNTGYHPDREYVDGVLVERVVPTIIHALFQIILGSHFRQFEREFRFQALPEVRTQIIQRARYRIPDLMLCPVPMPQGRVIDVAPLAVIEILSPDDKMSETLQRYRDYASIGVKTIIQMDPEACVAHSFEDGSLVVTRFTTIHLPHIDRHVPFNSDAIFKKLRSEYEEATASE